MIDVDMHSANSDITLVVNLHLTREWRLRRWIASQLIMLAARILCCGIEFEDA